MTVDAPADGLWLSIAEIARIENKSKQAISKRVAALVKAGALTSKPGARGTKLINLAAFRLAIGSTGDPVKEAAAETVRDLIVPPLDAPAPALAPITEAPGAPGGSYRDAQARKTQFEADLAEIRLKEKLGEVVPVETLETIAAEIAEVIVRIIDREHNHAPAMAAAVGKDGEAGARAKFKEISRETRTLIADAMKNLLGNVIPARSEDGGNAPDGSEGAAPATP